MKRRILWRIGFCVLGLALILGIARYIELHNRQNNPIADQIYKLENAIKEVDDSYECKYVSTVTPYTYADSEGNTIVCYCCLTTYFTDKPMEYTGLNMEAIGMVIDADLIENKRECAVNAYDAFQCEIGDRTYLCWTLSPEISCVIEYSKDAAEEADIFRMAESVSAPAE